MTNPPEQRGNIALMFSSSVVHEDRFQTKFAQHFNKQKMLLLYNDRAVNKYAQEGGQISSHLLKTRKHLLSNMNLFKVTNEESQNHVKE